MARGPVTIVDVHARPLSVPLTEPFVIATARLDTTQAALVELTLEDGRGGRARGFGEAAALPPVTREHQHDLLAAIAAARAPLTGTTFGDLEAAADLVHGLVPSLVARAAVEVALLDAWARLQGVPLYAFLAPGAPAPPALDTDITLPITEAAHMADLGRAWAKAGFTCFKVKVGRDWALDLAALTAVHAAVPTARFRLDANAGFDARAALTLLDAALARGLVIECYEQPCAADDLAGLAEVQAHAPIAVVADESCKSLADVDRLVGAKAVRGINLKLVKLGGPLTAIAVARRARAAGLSLMAGAMVETRLGLVAMAHVVSALGGVDWVDLDTAFLLAHDPFVGGWRARGARLELTAGPGLDLALGPDARLDEERAGS
jgi:L-alanine-DL-glutamate epimerase-like enolase superfamily enzyme